MESRWEKYRPLVERHKAGERLRFLAKEAGCCEVTFRSAIKALNPDWKGYSSFLRESAVQMLHDGISIADVAKAVGRSLSWMQQLCNELEIPFDVGMARKKLAEDRRLAAAKVKGGDTIHEVASGFRRSICWVRHACAEHGVKPPKQWDESIARDDSKTLKCIALLQNYPDKTGGQIACEVDCTRSLVNLVLHSAHKVGIRFPGRRVTVIDEAVNPLWDSEDPTDEKETNDETAVE